LIGRKPICFSRRILLHGVSILPANILSSADNLCKVNHYFILIHILKEKEFR
jgi:hypothetical protein